MFFSRQNFNSALKSAEPLTERIRFNEICISTSSVDYLSIDSLKDTFHYSLRIPHTCMKAYLQRSADSC